jgi:hypothetical protein
VKAYKRSPLKDNPLRNPGQSVDEQRADLVFDKVLGPFLVTFLVILLAALEWWRQFSGSPPQPWLYTILAVLVAGYAAWQVYRAWPQVRDLRLAREGEIAVGQYLEHLRGSGYQVFHDVLGQGFNVDHVVIGPAGVFTVETKTWSKPLRGEARIVVEGERIIANGLEPERNPLVQAMAQASWLRSLLEESTGRMLPVRPAILFPGWFVERPPAGQSDVWVLNPKALPAFLGREPERLSAEEIKLAAFHLSRYVRGSSGKHEGQA